MAALDLPADGSDPFEHNLTTYNEWLQFTQNLRRRTLHASKSNLLTDNIISSVKEGTPQRIIDYLEQQSKTIRTLIKMRKRMVVSFNRLVDADTKILRSLSKKTNSPAELSELVTWGEASKNRQRRFAQEIESISNSIERIQQAAGDIAMVYM